MKNSKKWNANKRDLYQEVTDRIIAMLEKGTVPWRRTWNRYGLARNGATGHIYTGINMLLMNMAPYPIPYFLTFKQVKEKGGKIRKGAKADSVFYYNVYFKDSDGNKISKEAARSLRASDKKVEVLSFLKYYNVFNIADIEGIEFEFPEVELKDNERIEKCEAIVSDMPDSPAFNFIDADRAFYSPAKDMVNMPNIRQFGTSEEHYATLFHELVHSTGHEKRLARSGITEPNKFGSKGYGEEELIAEMGASFLCGHAGIDREEITGNSAAYLQGWLDVLKKDKKLVFKSAAEAQKAVDFVLGKC